MMCLICLSEAFPCAIKEGYEHYRCDSCGHIQLFPLPSDETLQAYYSSEYIYTDCCGKLNENEKPSPSISYIRTNFLGRPSSRFLDVGAGNGKFLKELKGLGFNHLFAVEPNKSLVQILNNSGFKVERGVLDRSSFSGELFDVINAGDVIEHLTDPVSFIQILRNKLEVGGVLIVTTPNVDSPWSKYTYFLFKYFHIPWSTLTPIAHINNFSLSSLELLLRKNSFKIISSHFNAPGLKYELGHTHLFRDFRERKTLKYLFRWLFGWGVYFLGYVLFKMLPKRNKVDFRMTLIAQVSSD